MSTSLHICHGLSAAWSLSAAGMNPTLALNHTFEGRIQNHTTYEAYEDTAHLQPLYQYLKIVDGLDISEAALFHYKKDGQAPSVPITKNTFLETIGQSDIVIVWVSLGFHENLLLAFLIRLFTLYSLPLEKIKIKRIESQLINGKPQDILSTGEIPPKELQKNRELYSLSQTEFNLLIQGWDAITSEAPSKTEAYLALPIATQFQKGLLDFQNRHPSVKTGLNRCQTDLLATYPASKAQVMGFWLIGSVLGQNHTYHLDVVGDGYVIWNLMQLTNLYAKEPAFIIENPYTREQTISLTDFGHALRNGTANWRDKNPVDYYVGNIHIYSMT